MYRPVLVDPLHTTRGDIDYAKTVTFVQNVTHEAVTPTEMLTLVTHTTFANGQKFYRNNTEYTIFDGGAAALNAADGAGMILPNALNGYQVPVLRSEQPAEGGVLHYYASLSALLDSATIFGHAIAPSSGSSTEALNTLVFHTPASNGFGSDVGALLVTPNLTNKT